MDDCKDKDLVPDRKIKLHDADEEKNIPDKIILGNFC